MDESQVIELFECMRIQNKFDPRLSPFRIMRRRNIEEMRELLDSVEYKRFRSYCPNLARGIEEYFTCLGSDGV